MWIEMKLRPDYRGNLCGVEDGCGLNLRVRQHPKPHYGGGDIRAQMLLRTFEPENRLVARGLETEWEKRLRDLALAEAELARREQQHPRTLSPEEKNKIRFLGSDLKKVWTAPTTTDRDRKELLRTLLEEVIVTVDRPERRAHLTLRWRGGTLTELDLSLPRSQPRGYHTDEDTISLLRRLTAHYSDDVIAGILNRQGRKTAT